MKVVEWTHLYWLNTADWLQWEDKERKWGKGHVQWSEAHKFCCCLWLWSVYVGPKTKCTLQDIS